MRLNRAVVGLGTLLASGAVGCQIVIDLGGWVVVNGGEGGGSGTTNSTGGTGGATGTVCTPGEKVACYDGPSGTEDVGNCKGGMATCNDEGTAFGTCDGEVKPGPEQPDVIGDEACDGYKSGEPVWWATFGDTGNEVPQDIAGDAEGNLFVCGTFDGTLQFGDNDPLVSQGEKDIFLVKLNRDGVPLWSHRFGSPLDQDGCLLASDGANGVYLAGSWPGPMFFGGDSLPSGDTAVARFDAFGDHVWSHRVGDPWSARTVRDIAVLKSGDVVVLGTFEDQITFGGENITATTGADVYVARYSIVGGAYEWGITWPDLETASDGDEAPVALAISSNDEIGVISHFQHGVTVDGSQGQTLIVSSKQSPFVVVQYASGGTLDWAQLYEYEQSDNYDEPLQLTAAQSDGFLLAVQHSGLTVGGIAVTSLSSAAGASAPYLDLSIQTPGPSIRCAGNAAGDLVFGLRVLNTDSLAGKVFGPAAGGGGVANAVVGVVHTNSLTDWSATLAGQLGSADSQGIPAVAPAGLGGLVTAVSFNKKVVFGGEALISKGGDDIAVARFAP